MKTDVIRVVSDFPNALENKPQDLFYQVLNNKNLHPKPDVSLLEFRVASFFDYIKLFSMALTRKTSIQNVSKFKLSNLEPNVISCYR